MSLLGTKTGQWTIRRDASTEQRRFCCEIKILWNDTNKLLSHQCILRISTVWGVAFFGRVCKLIRLSCPYKPILSCPCST